MTEPSITGTIVGQHLAVLRERYGSESVDRVLASLDDTTRDDVAHASPLGWVPVQTFERFYDAMAAGLQRDVAELHTEVSRASVENTFRTLWRLLLRFTSDEALVSRTPLIHSRTYNTGALASSFPGPGRADIELTGWPRTPAIVRRGLCVGISTVLTLAGRQNVTITDEPTADGARFQASWDARGRG